MKGAHVRRLWRRLRRREPEPYRSLLELLLEAQGASLNPDALDPGDPAAWLELRRRASS